MPGTTTLEASRLKHTFDNGKVVYSSLKPIDGYSERAAIEITDSAGAVIAQYAVRIQMTNNGKLALHPVNNSGASADLVVDPVTGFWTE